MLTVQPVYIACTGTNSVCTMPDMDAYKIAIGNLLLHAGSNEIVKRVISVFDYSVPRSTNLKSLRAFNLDMLEPCAVFFNIELADAAEKKLYTKDTLATRILFAIHALLPSECGECNETYTVEFEAESKPAFHCHMCFQGSHNCARLTGFHDVLSRAAIDYPVSLVWLCKSCKESSNPIKARKSKVRHESASKPNPAISRIRDDLESRNSSTVSTPAEPADDLSHSTHNSAGINGSEFHSKLLGVVKDRVCQKYKKGTCPHGLKGNKEHNGHVCEFEHPRYCRKFCRFGTQRKFGCNKGSECKYLHPVLCKFSVKSKLCTNRDCTFIHLKGTRRKESDATRDIKAKKTKPATRKNESEPTNAPPDRFLELKRVVDSMQSSFMQEMSVLRSSLLPLMSYHPQYHLNRAPIQMGTCLPQYPQFPPPQSSLNVSSIPHVSC